MRLRLGWIATMMLMSQASLVVARPLDKVRKDALTVGIRVGNPPFGYNETGDRKGLEYDLAAAIAEGLGCRFRVVNIQNQRDGEDMLQTDKVDLVLGSIKATPEIKERFYTSNPYFRTGLGIMVMRSNQSIFTLTDLNDRYVAATPETNADKLIESFLPKAKLEVVRNTADGLGMLQKGDVEAMVHDRSMLQTEAQRNSAFRLLDVSLTEDNYVMLVNKRSSNLLDAVNGEINRLRTVPSPEAVSPLAAICARYKLGATIKPIVRAGAPSMGVPAVGLPAASDAPPPAARPTTRSSNSDQSDLEQRLSAAERQILDMQRALSEITATLQQRNSKSKR
jgi:polar amino acid transport system substrate-binding protein